jgi:hypothetical protein
MELRLRFWPGQRLRQNSREMRLILEATAPLAGWTRTAMAKTLEVLQSDYGLGYATD